MDTTIEAKRFKQVREQLNLTQVAFGEQLGLSFSTADIERGKTRISGNVTMRLLRDFNINPLWLFGESTKMYLNPNQISVMPKAITVNQDGHENILMVNEKAAAGYGQNIGDAEYMNSLPAFGFPLPEYRNASFRGFQITGDSMIPLVNAGDWVLAKAVDSYDAVINNQVYVVVEEESIRLKKVVKSLGNQVELISLNPEYPPVKINATGILELWEYHSKISFGANLIQGLTLQTLYDEINAIKLKLE